ncbi:hypothetical protein FISHEDRAFT_74801 [Fistulina hepatica ATCC 64428]|uniref:Ubiquitin-like protease family profile domain-containing protein n=1 Tax=Fistulina hepatica ATCC 64428 TaxID=1128425 RepID=A0A0D7A8Y6_9AGAR|nr:hypothetical protein FISHEDRAFT_74801 [Fistulina hepatica ATCC 64428]
MLDGTIPRDILGQLLPANALSILEMLKHPLPASVPAFRTYDVQAFFRNGEPDLVALETSHLVLVLRNSPIPPRMVVSMMVEEMSRRNKNEKTSVCFAHLMQNAADPAAHSYPLFCPWENAQAWIMKQLTSKDPDTRQLAEETMVLLGGLPYDMPMCGLEDSHGLPMHLAWRYLGPHYTTASMQNDLIGLLRQKIVTNMPWIRCFRIERLEFTKKIIEAYKRRDNNVYNCEQLFRWVKRVGDDIAERKQEVLTIVHLDGLVDTVGTDPQHHFVALSIDGSTSVLRYGDSLGHKMPRLLFDAYSWWTNQHGLRTFNLESLPITAQKDGHSCGTLAQNALEHRVDPVGVPLTPAKAVAAEHLRSFLKVAHHALASHDNRVVDAQLDEFPSAPFCFPPDGPQSAPFGEAIKAGIIAPLPVSGASRISIHALLSPLPDADMALHAPSSQASLDMSMQTSATVVNATPCVSPGAGNMTPGVLPMVLDTMPHVLPGALDAMLRVPSKALDAMPCVSSRAFDAMPRISSGALDATPRVSSGELDVMPCILTRAFDAMPRVSSGALDATSRVLSGELDAMPRVSSEALDATPHVLSGELDAMPHVSSGALDATPRVLSRELDAMPHVSSGALDTTPRVLSGAMDAMPRVSSGAFDAMPYILPDVSPSSINDISAGYEPDALWAMPEDDPMDIDFMFASPSDLNENVSNNGMNTPKVEHTHKGPIVPSQLKDTKLTQFFKKENVED